MGESGYHRILNHLTQGSSILLQLPAIRWAWLTILRKARRGEVRDLTVASLILEAHITVEDATDALRIFTSPDPLSTSPEEDGRRLIAIDSEPGAYRLVNWERYAERIERANAATRKARSRDMSRSASKSHDVPRSAAHSRRETVDVRQETEESKSKASVRSPRGSRIPDGFPDEAAMEWACRVAGKSPREATAIAENFRDYWLAKAGKDGRKADWMATWRGWVRREGSTVRGNSKAEKKIPFGGKRWNNDTQSFED